MCEQSEISAAGHVATKLHQILITKLTLKPMIAAL